MQFEIWISRPSLGDKDNKHFHDRRPQNLHTQSPRAAKPCLRLYDLVDMRIICVLPKEKVLIFLRGWPYLGRIMPELAVRGCSQWGNFQELSPAGHQVLSANLGRSCVGLVDYIHFLMTQPTQKTAH